MTQVLSNYPEALEAEGDTGFRPIPASGRLVLLTLVAVLATIHLVAPFLVLALLKGLGLGYDSDEGRLPFTVAVLVTQAILVALLLYLVLIRRKGLTLADLGLRRPLPGWYLRAAMIAAIAVPTVGGINALLALILGEAVRNPQIESLAPNGFSWGALAAITLTAGIIAPIFEELTFRGLLFSWLRGRLNLAWAATISGAVFSVAHGVLILMPALFAVGVALAVVYEKSGSLWAAIIVHSVFNVLMTLGLYGLLAAGLPIN